MTELMDRPLDMGDVRTQGQLQYLLDRAAIHDVICNYALGVDTRDWALFRTCFADEIEADFTSLGDMGLFRGTGDKWVELAQALIENLDATQHLMGNITAQIEGDRAVARCYVQAQHVRHGELGEPRYIIAGHYRHEMIRTPQGWRSKRYSLTALWTSGNRALFSAAIERARKGTKGG